MNTIAVNMKYPLRTAVLALFALSGLGFGDSTGSAPLPPDAKVAIPDVKSAEPTAKPSPEKPKGTVTIKVFSEWFYDFTDKSNKESGFDLTRAYLGYKHDFSEKISGNVTLDVARSNEVVTATFDTTTKSIKTTADNRYKAFLKTAALKYQDILPLTTLEMGMVGTNQLAMEDKLWGYRYITRTFMDLNGFGATADLGAKLTVKVNEYLGVNAELLNGEGFTKPQDADGFYKMTGSLDLKLPIGLNSTVYYDALPFRNKDTQSNIAGFASYEMKGLFRAGAEFVMEIAKEGIKDHNLTGISGLAIFIVNNDIEVFGRFDMLQSEKDWNKAKDGKTIVAGLHYTPVKGVKTALNFQQFTSDMKGSDPQPKVKFNMEYSL